LLVLFIRSLIIKEYKNSQLKKEKLTLLSVSINYLLDLSLKLQFFIDDDLNESNRQQAVYFGEDFMTTL